MSGKLEKPFTVALIGPDGAGKTTVAKSLQGRLPYPVKYLYMGVNIESSNVALPTSRFVNFVKQQFGAKGPDGRSPANANGATPDSAEKSIASATTRSADTFRDRRWSHASASGSTTGLGAKKSKLRAAFRLLNRLAEEWYRQYLSWRFRRRGYIVLYDRHFIFDFEINGSRPDEPVFDRWHRWLLARAYPRPDLVLYLDAPAEVLYERKKEAPLAYLAARRAAFQRQGAEMNNFYTLDATRPLDEVKSRAIALIRDFAEGRLQQENQVPVKNQSGSQPDATKHLV